MTGNVFEPTDTNCHSCTVTGELGPQENSVRGDLGPLENSVHTKSDRSVSVYVVAIDNRGALLAP